MFYFLRLIYGENIQTEYTGAKTKYAPCDERLDFMEHLCMDSQFNWTLFPQGDQYPIINDRATLCSLVSESPCVIMLGIGKTKRVFFWTPVSGTPNLDLDMDWESLLSKSNDDIDRDLSLRWGTLLGHIPPDVIVSYDTADAAAAATTAATATAATTIECNLIDLDGELKIYPKVNPFQDCFFNQGTIEVFILFSAIMVY